MAAALEVSEVAAAAPSEVAEPAEAGNTVFICMKVLDIWQVWNA